MIKKIIIVGAGQNGCVIKNILSLDSNNQVMGFLDDAKKRADILGKINDFLKYNEYYFFISIGENVSRKNVYLTLKKGGARFINVIHPAAVIEKNVRLGENVMIGAFTYININAKIDNNSFINNGCIIEHDNTIGEHTHLAPGVVSAGMVAIGNNVFVGINSSIRDKVRIGNYCTIGAGSNVVADCEPSRMYYGNPAKIIDKL